MKMKRGITTLLSVAVLSTSLVACSGTPEKTVAKEEKVKLTEQQLMADLWYQTAGETKALYYQGYNIGQLKLDAILAKGTEKKPAIVLDLDETVLDNSPHQAMSVKTGKGYPYKWDDWINKAEAEALPGTIDFLKYTESKGVDIYYISNRKTNQLDATIKNLERVGAPQATKEHILLQDPKEKGKEKRRELVSQTHDIVLFFGDNLSDFTGFDGKSVKDRNQTVADSKAQFGEKFIIFPNPMYGDWEGALYDYDFKKSDAEKDKIRRDNLKSFDVK
ncbi:5'-nucleotidase, lipoprotein e(P4) family [Bacillus cereus group sp. MYBK15-3]|uniref:5'-nucleotidase, lipoprotein e(P4) family n=1 Tax=Bacillus cereus group TaxID=86661 RepID=UPI000C29243F|nr:MULTISPECIES: 5'-nucleotidase, lipoprotein e(P4) family [Bacillus cereus group]USL07192.1 5'-nucleotidase, lipoprotein e(P4) family [Bacillus bombysepticus]